MALFKKAPAASSGAKKKSDSPLLVAADVKDPASGQTLWTKEQVAESIKGYAQGKELERQGQALMETHKPALSEFGRQGMARLWVAMGTRPRSPKLMTKADGSGTQVTMSFIDRSSMMNDDQYSDLEALVGADNAAQAVERFTQYSIDAKLASQTITINGEKATVQDHIEKALLSYFPEAQHELLGEMLKPKEVFQTKKGVIDRLLDFVGRNHPKAADRLAEALVKARVIIAYKPGAVGDDD